MPSSWKRQQQTYYPTKSRRYAHRTVRHPFHFIGTPKRRLIIVSLSIVASLGLPALVLATQQYSKGDSSPTVTSPDQPTPLVTSSTNEEVFSSSVVDVQVLSSPKSSSEIVGQATVNGEVIPLMNGSSTTRLIEGDSNSVEVDVSVKNGDSSTSVSSSSSTEVNVESHSSSNSDTNQTRGSPRR